MPKKKEAQATEAVHTKNVGLEKLLAKRKGVGDRLEGFSTVTTSCMWAETW